MQEFVGVRSPVRSEAAGGLPAKRVWLACYTGRPYGTEVRIEGHARFRIRGQGIEKQGQKGDQIVTVRVKLPEKLTAEQEKAFREFVEAG